MFAQMRPDAFRVERKASFKVPPEKIYALLNDFKAWGAWSPWEKKDPAMKRTFGAITVGKGAHYAWEGNKDVGQGSMEITESVPSSKVLLKLDFLKPFEAHNTVDFMLTPSAGGTDLTWGMDGKHNFISKMMCLFMDMDKMVGKDFEAGLASLKTIVDG